MLFKVILAKGPIAGDLQEKIPKSRRIVSPAQETMLLHEILKLYQNCRSLLRKEGGLTPMS